MKLVGKIISSKYARRLTYVALWLGLFIAYLAPPLRRDGLSTPLIAVILVGLLLLYSLRFINRHKSVNLHEGRGRRMPILKRVAIWRVCGIAIYFALVTWIDLESRENVLVRRAERDVITSPVAKSSLGSSIKIGWPIKQRSVMSGNSGHAEFELRVIGEKASGKLYVEGNKENGIWKMTNIYLVMDGTAVREPISAVGPS